MDENYLHDKIRQHEERLQKIEDTCKPLDESKEEITKMVTCLVTTLNDRYLKQLRGEYDNIIKQNYTQHMNDSNKRISRHVTYEIKEMMKIDKERLDKYKSDVKNYTTRQAQQLKAVDESFSLCILILIEKGIMTQEEFKTLRLSLNKLQYKNISETS